MNEFRAMMQSLLENVVDYVGKDRLQAVQVIPDELTGSAHVDVCLTKESAQTVRDAIGRIAEVRDMFMDDVAVDYTFKDESLTERIRQEHPDLAVRV